MHCTGLFGPIALMAKQRSAAVGLLVAGLPEAVSRFEEVRNAGDLQNSDHGRVLRFATGVQDPVWRTQAASGLSSGRSRSDQFRGFSRAPAGARAQGPD